MKQRGMTLVELMVAMVIGLGITLAVTTLLISGDNHKRTTTSTNDAEQTGSYVFYALDKVLRGAGSAIAETAYPTDHGVLGCTLNVASGGTTLFPRTAAFPYPFGNFLAGVTNTLTVSPVLIGQNQAQGGSDVIAVMGGSGAAGGVSRQISGGGSATTMTLDNSVGFLQKDMVLVSQPGTPPFDCLLEELSLTPTTSTLNVASAMTYYTMNGVSTNLATMAANTLSYVTPLGNADANNLQFMLYGVDSDNRLYSYDLLQNLNRVQLQGTDVAQAMADGVIQMNAIYGIDTNTDGKQDSWVAPGPPDAAWAISNVMASAAQMEQIVSVRVAIVVRGEYYDKNAVSPASITLFKGLTDAGGNALQKVITPLDQHYRYRVFEFTVPLRNMLLLAGVS